MVVATGKDPPGMFPSGTVSAPSPVPVVLRTMNGTEAESDLPPIVRDCGDSSRIHRAPFLIEKSVLEPVCSSACIPAATPLVGVTVISGPAMPEAAKSPVTVRVLELAVSAGSVPERLNVQAFEALPPAPQVR